MTPNPEPRTPNPEALRERCEDARAEWMWCWWCMEQGALTCVSETSETTQPAHLMLPHQVQSPGVRGLGA
jgi:hypothetical protein